RFGDGGFCQVELAGAGLGGGERVEIAIIFVAIQIERLFGRGHRLLGIAILCVGASRHQPGGAQVSAAELGVDANGLAEIGGGGAERTLVAVCVATIDEHGGVVRIDPYSLAVVANRFAYAIQAIIRVAAAVKKASVIGIERNRLVVVLKRARKVALVV